MPKRRVEATTAIDIKIGVLMRLRRAQLGMSQAALAQKLGLACLMVASATATSN
jgi:transcriptional regulator with XRE-family HTH domain